MTFTELVDKHLEFMGLVDKHLEFMGFIDEKSKELADYESLTLARQAALAEMENNGKKIR